MIENWYAGRRETIARGLRMNCICPGPGETPMLDGIIADIGARSVDAYARPSNRRSTPKEQAVALVFLGSGAASDANGITLDIDGGLRAAAEAGVVDLARLLEIPASEKRAA